MEYEESLDATVEHHEIADNTPMNEMIDEAQPDQMIQGDDNDSSEQVAPRTKMIPLHVAQKLREKNREIELQLQWERQERERLLAQRSAPQQPEQEDNSRYESATREDLTRSQDEIIRVVEERSWIKNNPEKYERVNDYLPTFLKQRPNLAAAIKDSPNRYEEAYTLMEALTPKQQQQLKKDVQQPSRKPAPNAPGSVPKAAALNEAVDVMNMTDAEFNAWKTSKRRR